MKYFAAIFLTAMFSAGVASAQLLFEDSFSYADGPLITAVDSPWQNNYLPTNEINVVNGELILDQSEQESVRYDFPKGYYTNMYVAFKVRFTALPAGAGNYFAFFRGHLTDALFGRVTVLTNGAAAGKFRMGITMMSAPPSLVPVDLSLGTTYTIVMRLSNAQFISTAKLWINPSSELDTSLYTIVEYNNLGYSLGHFGFKQRAFYELAANGMGILAVDDLKIGFRFTDVIKLVGLNQISRLSGSVQLAGTGLAGTNYAVLARTNFSQAWQKLGTVQAATNGVIQYTDSTATNLPVRFYRLLAE